MGAGPRLAVAAVDAASQGLAAVVVENQVGMSAGAAEPPLNTVLRQRDGRADGMFCGSAVGIGRGARDVAFLFEALAEFVIGPANMLTEYVAACGFITAQVAWGTLPELSPDFVPPGRGSGRAPA